MDDDVGRLDVGRVERAEEVEVVDGPGLDAVLQQFGLVELLRLELQDRRLRRFHVAFQHEVRAFLHQRGAGFGILRRLVGGGVDHGHL